MNRVSAASCRTLRNEDLFRNTFRSSFINRFGVKSRKEYHDFTFSIPRIIIQLFKFETTDAHSFIKFTIKSHSEEFSAALLHAENVKQLFYAIVCSLMMGQSGLKHVRPGVLK